MKFAVMTLITFAVLFNLIDDVSSQYDTGYGGGYGGESTGEGSYGSPGSPSGSTAEAPKKDEDFIHQLEDKVTKSSIYRHLRHPIHHLECKHHLTTKGCPVHKKRANMGMGMDGMGMDGMMGGMGLY